MHYWDAVFCIQDRPDCNRRFRTKSLRFHVLANSDSEADQNLKLAVRDAVGSFMQEKLTAVENLEECEMVVRQSLGESEEAAAETIAENGYDYDVTAGWNTLRFR